LDSRKSKLPKKSKKKIWPTFQLKKRHYGAFPYVNDLEHTSGFLKSEKSQQQTKNDNKLRMIFIIFSKTDETVTLSFLKILLLQKQSIYGHIFKMKNFM